MVLKAILFSATKHNGQVRKISGLPYVTHPIIVSEFIRKFKGDSKHIEELVCAALLHDVLEDTDTTEEELIENFGEFVTSLVVEMTSDISELERIGNKNEYLIEKMKNMSSYGLVLKLSDRLSNILDNPKEKYVNDTKIMVRELSESLNFTKTQRALVEEIGNVIEQYEKRKETYGEEI